VRATIEVIIPPKFNYPAMTAVLKDEGAEIVKGMKHDYQKTVKTWKTQPEFRPRRWAMGGRRGMPRKFKVSVGPVKGRKATRIFNYVDQGTKPHKITPKKKGGVLVFMWGGPGSYRAKSRVRKLRAYKGGITGAKLHFRKFVKHPGSKAREFTQVIEKKWQRVAPKRFDKAMRRAAKASGHAHS